VLLFGVTSASADPISDKRAQASAVQSQISALDTKAEIATEAYNRSRDRYNTLTSKVHATSYKLSVIRGHMHKLQTSLDSRADHMYRQGPLGFLEVLLNAKSFDDFNTSLELLTNISTQDANTVSDLKSAKNQSETLYATLKSAQKSAGIQKAAMASNKARVLAHLSERKTMLASINADIRNLIAAQQAAEAAAARANAASNGFVMDTGGNPPTSSKGAAAVWWAEKALGAPYVWAGSGPNEFDCSGLVMWAYGHVGVSLPHSSAEQIGYGQRVGRAYLQPGDLVFFGSPIHHVGMYVGGGSFIEAPHTGAVVRIASLDNRGDYAGACRP
jgi:cell wall-associated NlpC family hydrolase